MPLAELVDALTLLRDHANPDPTWPTHCEHDVLVVLVDPETVPDDVKARLKAMGFEHGPHEASGDIPCFYSFRYGSA